MKHRISKTNTDIFYFFLAILILVGSSCNNNHPNIAEKEIVTKPEEIDQKAEDIIQGTLKDLLQAGNELPDSVKIKNAPLLQVLYSSEDYKPFWSHEGRFLAPADSLFQFIDSAKNYGLFPQDYYQQRISTLRTEVADTSKENKLDAAKWAHADLLLTSAFTQLVKDLFKGRLQHDSILAKDSLVNLSLFTTALKNFQTLPSDSFAKLLEPKHAGYAELKKALHTFLSKAIFKSYTRIFSKDSTKIPGLVYKRLTEVDSLNVVAQTNVDSTDVALAIKKYQKKAGLKVDGKMNAAVISRLNNTDAEKFIRIAITLDKFKSLQPLPRQYIWVNIPAYRLQVMDSDTVVMTSKVVVGKAETKTPQITSAITDMITYPKWHLPESIIKNDILPGLKRDAGYTLRKGYTLFDANGNEVDPYSVDWHKYKTGIPYSVVQGSGDENALGVLKFNFPNKFSVYLHDTNQRYLFAKQARTLSHGCVRVQAWQELAYFLLRNDSLQTGKALPVDSLNNWLAQKEKHVIPVKKKFPLFIRYFSCEAKDDRVVFYEDVYGEDKRTRERFFSNK